MKQINEMFVALKTVVWVLVIILTIKISYCLVNQIFIDYKLFTFCLIASVTVALSIDFDHHKKNSDEENYYEKEI